MDHLPDVKHPYRPVKIRYMPSICYDDRGFYDFPERRGWTDEKLKEAHADNSRLRRDALAFLQSWLYFATLREVMGVPVWTSDFIRHDRGQLWITTKRLPAYLRDWEDSVASAPLAEERDRLRKATECLSAVAEIVTDLAERQPVNGTSRILTPEHALSIAFLVFTLNLAIGTVYKRSDRTEYRGYLFKKEASFVQLVRSRFSGSCPSLFDRLEQRLHFTGLYYASLLGPPSVSENHGECTQENCIVEKVDIDRYSTAHSHSGCDCEHVHMDWRTLLPLVFFDKIPIVSLENNSHGLQLKVVPFVNHIETPYVTISHVWSHGLGNPQANSLPECQLRILHQRIMDSDPQQLHYFWIDTLCVPIEPPTARRRAIEKMKDIYRSSELVLVLDAELVRSTCRCTLEETLMRINRSRWLTRLWTLQEAVLGRRLVFQFFEGPVDMISFEADVQQKLKSDNPGEQDILFEAIEFWSSFVWLRKSEASQANKLQLLCRDVGWRSTSRAEDESICYACILDMDLQRLLDAPGDQRMQLFWSLQRQIPLALLFEPGQRLQNDGFRWAHSSLLNVRLDENYQMSVDDRLASVGPQGLNVECFGIFLSISVKVISNFVRFKHKREDTWYVMTLRDDINKDDWKNAIALSLGSPVLILRNKVEVDDREYTDGILATYRKQESETLLVRYICRVMVIKQDSYVDTLSNNSMLASQEGESEAVGDPTEVKKRWCIS